MRLWSITPDYLDVKGLLALWREALLAKAVLENKTIGYKNHPQLIRFKNYENPLKAINAFLTYVYLNSKARGYNFDKSKIKIIQLTKIIKVSKKQVEYEFWLLQNKLVRRDKNKYLENKKIQRIKVNPIFKIVNGEIEEWEKIKEIYY
ncbi:MAG TPA: pyrimidine dimer DNA glycosylase/endonuclease V [bacterium]|nr:pyrimidine dimer DNA glycosylase/endonuclease V [bacterium]HOL48060.1 pyrimidine dimer DNA glycosylase/endonuclease V [bacterium]HPQ19917.1 pyrimidine dimer DNA glycosylase/endonuclease V [bacterium]